MKVGQWGVGLRGSEGSLKFIRCHTGAESVVEVFQVTGGWNDLNDFAPAMRGGFACPFLRWRLGPVGTRRIILRKKNKRGSGREQSGEAFAVFRPACGDGGNAWQSVRQFVPASKVERGQHVELRFKSPNRHGSAGVADDERQARTFWRVEPKDAFASVWLALHGTDMGAHDRATSIVNREREAIAKEADESACLEPFDKFW